MTLTNKAKILIAAVVLIAAFSIFFFFSPEESSIFPPCPFHYMTGYDCPGCGSQRATHNLLHLRIGKAFSYNPLLVLALPYVLFGLYMEYMGGKKRYPALRKSLYGKKAAIIIFIVVIVYWIGRNII